MVTRIRIFLYASVLGYVFLWNREGKILQNRTIFRNFAEEYISALVVQWIEWEIPNFQIGVRFPSEVPPTHHKGKQMEAKSHKLTI